MKKVLHFALNWFIMCLKWCAKRVGEHITFKEKKMIKLTDEWMKVYKSMDKCPLAMFQCLAFEISVFDVARTFKKEGGHRYISKEKLEPENRDVVKAKKTMEFLENDDEMSLRTFSKTGNVVVPQKLVLFKKKNGRLTGGAFHDFEHGPERIFTFKMTENGNIKDLKEVEAKPNSDKKSSTARTR